MTTPTAQPLSAAGFDASLFQHLYEAEDKHFWFRSRNRLIGALVRQLTKNFQSDSRVLEVGCGNGNVLRVLEKNVKRGEVAGIEPFAEAVTLARGRVSCKVIQGDVRALPFSAEFDLVCMFDVLEHIANDEESLGKIIELLKPNGILLLTVPAHKSLWSYFDDISHHYRRYEKNGLKSLLEQKGLAVEYLTFFQSLTYPLVWLGRRMTSLTQNQSVLTEEKKYQLALRELKVTPIINEILYALLSFETNAIKYRWQLPLGTSLLAVARKIN